MDNLLLTSLKLLVGAIPVAGILIKVYFKHRDRMYVDGMKLKLHEHTFNRTINIIEYNIKNDFYVLGDKVKEAVFRDIMLYSCDVWRDELENLVKRVDKLCTACENCQKESLMNVSRNYHIDAYVNAINKIRNFYKEDHFTKEESDLVKYSLEIFNNIEKETLDYIQKSFENMHTLITFNFCIRTVTANILTLYETMFTQMLIILDDSVAKSNGYFKNKSYRGISNE